MATISTLAVSLIARTSSFERGMKRSRSSLSRFQQTAARTQQRIASMAKGLLVAAGIGGMGFLLKNTMATIDATAKLSDVLGIATEKLIGLRHAANIAGVSNEALDKSLAMFVRRLGEVKLGTGEAKEGLKLLGLSADELISKSPADAMGIVADKIKRLENASIKGQAAYLLFGRSGQQLLNMLELGSAGMAEMQMEAERLGLTFNRIDAAKVEAANDAITRLKASMSGLVNIAVIKLAPSIERLANFMIKYRDSIVSVIGSLLKWTAKTYIAIKAVKLVGLAVRGLIAAYKGLIAARTFLLGISGPAGWASIAASVVIATGAIVGINEVLDKTAGKVKDAISAAEGVEGPKSKLPTGSASILAKLTEEKKFLALLLKNEAEMGLRESGMRLKMAVDVEKRVTALRLSYTKARNAEVQQLMRDNVAKQLAERIKLEEAALSGLSEFSASLKNRLEDMELGPLAGALARLERAGKGLSGKALDEYNNKLTEAKRLVSEIAKREAIAAKATKDVSTARTAFNAGEFRQIRSAFVDVSALGGGMDPQLAKMDKQIEQGETTNILLKNIMDHNKTIQATL